MTIVATAVAVVDKAVVDKAIVVVDIAADAVVVTADAVVCTADAVVVGTADAVVVVVTHVVELLSDGKAEKASPIVTDELANIFFLNSPPEVMNILCLLLYYFAALTMFIAGPSFILNVFLNSIFSKSPN